MAGGGLPDIFGALGGGLSSLAGPGSGGALGGGSPNLMGTDPQSASDSLLTNPLVASEAAVSGSDPSITGQRSQQQQPPQQAQPQDPTFIQPQTPPQITQGPAWSTPGGATPAWPTPQQQAAAPNQSGATQATVSDFAQAPPADPNQAQPITAQAGAPVGQANIDTAKPTTETAAPAATADTGQTPPEAPAGQQRGQQPRPPNPLTQAGNFLKNIAKPGSSRSGFPNLLGDLLRGGPGAVMQDLLGLTNQVGSAYGQQQYGSQGATEHGYGYGAAQPSTEAPASSPLPGQAAPSPPTAVSPEPRAAQAERNVQAEIAAQEAGQKTQDRLPGGNIPWTTRPTQGVSGGPPAPPTQTAQAPPATPASLTTGTTGGGHAATPIAQGEIQISPYSRVGAPPMKPTQSGVDVSPLRNEIGNPNIQRQMAQMVSQEVGLKPGNTRAQIVQLETLRNRALYGIQGNGRYPDGVRAPTSLAQAGQVIHGQGPYGHAGYSGYYPNYNNQRVSPAQQAAFKRDVYDVVFPPDGSPGSNLSDVGWGPMTGNASNDPRQGEKGMVAKHQYMHNAQGYSMRKSGGDDYFREHVGPGQGLPPGGESMQALMPQRLSDQQASEMEGLVNTQAQLAPRGLPWQQYRQSENIEDVSGQHTLSQDEVRNQEVERARAQPPGRVPITAMSRAAGFGDIDPLIDQLAQQWAMQTMGGGASASAVPMPRPRPR